MIMETITCCGGGNKNLSPDNTYFLIKTNVFCVYYYYNQILFVSVTLRKICEHYTTICL